MLRAIWKITISRKLHRPTTNMKPIPDFAKVVTIKDIEDNNFSLSIPLYVKHSLQEGEVDERSVQEHYERLESRF